MHLKFKIKIKDLYYLRKFKEKCEVNLHVKWWLYQQRVEVINNHFWPPGDTHMASNVFFQWWNIVSKIQINHRKEVWPHHHQRSYITLLLWFRPPFVSLKWKLMYSVITICPGQDFQKLLKVLAPLSDINGTLLTECGQLLMPGILYTKQNGSRFSKVWMLWKCSWLGHINTSLHKMLQFAFSL